MGIYFQLLVFNIPGVNVFIRFIVTFLQILSAIFIAFMLRGNWLSETKYFAGGHYAKPSKEKINVYHVGGVLTKPNFTNVKPTNFTVSVTGTNSYSVFLTDEVHINEHNK